MTYINDNLNGIQTQLLNLDMSHLLKSFRLMGILLIFNLELIPPSMAGSRNVHSLLVQTCGLLAISTSPKSIRIYRHQSAGFEPSVVRRTESQLSGFLIGIWRPWRVRGNLNSVYASTCRSTPIFRKGHPASTDGFGTPTHRSVSPLLLQ